MLRFIDGVGYVDIPDKENDWRDVPSDEMTLEQAQQAVRDLRKILAEYLEQKPCDDAISRKAVDELSKELVHTTRDKADFLCNFWERLQKLPSVTPQYTDKE